MVSVTAQNAQDLEKIMKDPDFIDTNGFHRTKNNTTAVDPYKHFVSDFAQHTVCLKIFSYISLLCWLHQLLSFPFFLFFYFNHQPSILPLFIYFLLFVVRHWIVFNLSPWFFHLSSSNCWHSHHWRCLMWLKPNHTARNWTPSPIWCTSSILSA